jgi:hypothetical protein
VLERLTAVPVRRLEELPRTTDFVLAETGQEAERCDPWIAWPTNDPPAAAL